MKITFCKTFNKVPYDVLSVAQAKRMHESRKRYEIVFEDGRGRIAEVTICVEIDGTVLVDYLDELKRPVSFHAWVPVEESRVFRRVVTDVLYLNDEPVHHWGKEWHYEEDGRVWTREGSRHGSEINQDHPPVDVSDHYEPLPAFGDYEAFHRLIRHGPPERVPAFDGDIVVVEPAPKLKAKRKPRR